MGKIKIPEDVKLFAAVMVQKEELFSIAEEHLERSLGPVDTKSEVYPFNHTDYYSNEMGRDLLKRIVSFKELRSPDNIHRVKITTNNIEKSLAGRVKKKLLRNVNIDPGYMTLEKVVLLTTKNYDHRIYLADGIYAEVTLRYRQGTFRPMEWTYPDYRMEAVKGYFNTLRKEYIRQLKGF
ncbi:MAG: DUF4416 family protein [Fidelibacterota bacterium]